MKINRVSYEILEDTISLYISFNEFDEEDIIVKFMGDKEGNPNNLEEYFTTSTEKRINYYRTFIKVIPTVNDEYMNYGDPKEIVKKRIERSKLMLDKVLNEFFMKIPIIDSVSPFPMDPYTDFEDDEATVYTDGMIITKEDLIAYLANKLIEKNIDIVQETYKNYEKENQLCRRI